MAAGYPKTQDAINSVLGQLAVHVNQGFRRATQLKTELDAYSDQALINAGFTAGEVTAIRAFAADLVQLESIYRGASTLGTAKDFKASCRPLWGVLGDF